jgi:hypothetical protein
MRYYLHLREPDLRTEDHQGSEFPNLLTARKEAIWAIRSLLSEEIKTSGKCRLHGRWIDICDEIGTLRDAVEFADAVSLA